jgi:malate/lactate dehydrogenase
MVHVAVAGTGRVGGQVAFTLVFERYVTELSLVDVVPEVAQMTKEELHHAIASHGFDVKINAYENDRKIKDADLIVIAAGYPRKPQMSRRDLAAENARIVKQLIEDTLDNNPETWYLIITNPVDAMATLAEKTAHGKRLVLGTGTNLETARFRVILSRELRAPIGRVEAYVGGEHGDAAVPLWSSVKIDGVALDEYLEKTKKKLDKRACEYYVKEVSREILQVLGGTRYGPAGSFIEIIRGITLNTGRIISYSRLRKFDTTPKAVHVTVPAKIAKSPSLDVWNLLTKQEKASIKKAAEIIYKTYSEAEGEKS